MREATVFLVFLAALLLYGSPAQTQKAEPEKTELHGHAMYKLLNPGEIPAVFEPEFVAAGDADRLFYPNEPLIVVADGPIVKAYSTWQLDRNEVVNDYINGKAITITWCPLCYTGIVYAATFDSVRYTFQSSGSLWQDAQVIQDIETGSLWAQINGVAIAGPLEGARLDLFPSSLTTYERFKQTYPDGLLLKKPLRGLENSNYREYFDDRTKLGIFGRVDKYRRLKGKELVVGVRLNGKQAAVTEKVLRKKGYVRLDELSPQVVVTCDDASLTISAFSLIELSKDQIDDLQLKDGCLVIKNTETSWDAVTGRLKTGSGRDLPPVPLTTAYWFAWVSFFPDTDLIK